jgi:inorganic pyrophosphatase
MIYARTIGLMTMIDSGKKDHKIIAVAIKDPEFNSYKEASEMPPHRLIMLRRFFQDYKQLEGKAVEVDEIRPAAEAYPIISDALHRYSEQRRKGFASHE